MTFFLSLLKKSKKRPFCNSIIIGMTSLFFLMLLMPETGYTQLSINKVAIKDSDGQIIDNSNPLLAGEEFWYVITFSVNTQVNDQIDIKDVFSPSSEIEPVDADPATLNMIEPVIALSNNLFTTNYTNPSNATYTNPYNQSNEFLFSFAANSLNTPSTTSEIRIKMKLKDGKIGRICPPGITLNNTANQNM